MTLFHIVLSLLSILLPITAFFTPLATAPWLPRQSTAAWLAGTSIYLAGGGSSGEGTGSNDVWTSPDGGLSWVQLASVPFSSLTGSSSGQVYADTGQSANNTNYIFGGRFTPTCSSLADSGQLFNASVPFGSAWTSQSGLPVRAFASAVLWTPPPISSLGSMIIRVGGSVCEGHSALHLSNDVWSYYYSDVTSSQSGQSNPAFIPMSQGFGPFLPVAQAGLVSILDGSRLVLAGGYKSNGMSNDVWVGVYQITTGSNGVEIYPTLSSPLGWSQVCSAAPWHASTPAMAATSNDMIYLLPSASPFSMSGVPSNAVFSSNAVWRSVDSGFTWMMITVADSFPSRMNPSLLAIGRQLILFGGAVSSTGDAFNDVWTAWS